MKIQAVHRKSKNLKDIHGTFTHKPNPLNDLSNTWSILKISPPTKLPPARAQMARGKPVLIFFEDNHGMISCPSPILFNIKCFLSACRASFCPWSTSTAIQNCVKKAQSAPIQLVFSSTVSLLSFRCCSLAFFSHLLWKTERKASAFFTLPPQINLITLQNYFASTTHPPSFMCPGNLTT